MSPKEYYDLGVVARVAGDHQRTDVGKPEDRGKVLVRLLDEAGFALTKKETP